jgi:hypothetical protein
MLETKLVEILELFKEQKVYWTYSTKVSDSCYFTNWARVNKGSAEGHWWAWEALPKNSHNFFHRMYSVLWLADCRTCPQLPPEWPAWKYHATSQLHWWRLEAVYWPWSSSHPLCSFHEPTSINRRLVILFSSYIFVILAINSFITYQNNKQIYCLQTFDRFLIGLDINFSVDIQPFVSCNACPIFISTTILSNNIKLRAWSRFYESVLSSPIWARDWHGVPAIERNVQRGSI